MPDKLPYRKFPCGECPVRRDNYDNPRSKFPVSRWEELRRTIEDPSGGHALMGAPLFGCHEGEPGSGADLLCAGWAASFGWLSVQIRLFVSLGVLPATVLRPGVKWPELYQDWDEMTDFQTLQPGDPDDHLPPELRGDR